MKRRTLLLTPLLTPLLLPLLLAGCTSVHYRAPGLGAGGGTLAVLPFEMVFTGKAPKNWTVADIERVEEAESLAFQRAFYDRLLHRASAHRARRIAVAIQPAETTNRLLADAGIGIRDSWALEPEELARVLGVDAVVRTSVVKTRYLSDPASYGIGVGVAILEEVLDEKADRWIPPGLGKTYDIHVDSVLQDGSDGALLWRVAVDRETDWHRPANDVVGGLTKKLAKKFPYQG